MKYNLFFFLAFTLLLIEANAQQNFYQKQNKIFESSCNQWIVKELSKNFPAQFSKNNYKDLSIFNSPTSKELVMGMTGNYDQEMAREFHELYFPKGELKRFLQLQSLADLYFPLIEKKLYNAGLPKSYKYLPVVLSGLNPQFEDDRDRAGIYALDYLTARNMGLRVDSLVDERRGGDFTIDAAIKEIVKLREKFDNNDEYVLKAIYISRAYAQRLYSNIEKEHTAIDDEADQFVSFFVYTERLFNQVFLKVSNQLPHYFDILGQYENLSFKQPVYFEALKDVLGADVEIHRELNPIFTGNQIEAQYRRASFILDNKAAARFAQLEDSLYAWKPVPKVILTESITVEEKSYHVVRRGESLSVIAQKHRTSIANLKKWNKLRGDNIRAGQRLIIYKTVRKRVPKSEENEPEVDTANANLPVEDVTKPDSTAKPIPQVPAQPIKQSDAGFITYTVKSGDSLWLIAKKYKTTPEKIMEWNKCNENIRPGQKLKIKK